MIKKLFAAVRIHWGVYSWIYGEVQAEREGDGKGGSGGVERGMKGKRRDKPVGDWISAPSPNFVAMATTVSPTTLFMVPLNRLSRKTPC